MSRFTDLTDAEVFRRAADYIRRHGWTQNAFYDNEGGACAWGALVAAANPALITVQGDWRARAIGIKFREHFARYLTARINGQYLNRWNDDGDRTAEEVIRVFEEIAAELEEKETMATGLRI
jgi:hypothetical protein